MSFQLHVHVLHFVNSLFVVIVLSNICVHVSVFGLTQVEGARSIGLSKLYNGLGITKQEHKNSFDYLRTLRGMDNIWLTVDYQQKIVGNLGPK